MRRPSFGLHVDRGTVDVRVASVVGRPSAPQPGLGCHTGETGRSWKVCRGPLAGFNALEASGLTVGQGCSLQMRCRSSVRESCSPKLVLHSACSALQRHAGWPCARCSPREAAPTLGPRLHPAHRAVVAGSLVSVEALLKAGANKARSSCSTAGCNGNPGHKRAMGRL